MEHAKCLDAFGRLSIQPTRLPNAPWYLLLGNEGVPESGRKVFITRKVNTCMTLEYFLYKHSYAFSNEIFTCTCVSTNIHDPGCNSVD